MRSTAPLSSAQQSGKCELFFGVFAVVFRVHYPRIVANDRTLHSEMEWHNDESEVKITYLDASRTPHQFLTFVFCNGCVIYRMHAVQSLRKQFRVSYVVMRGTGICPVPFCSVVSW